MDKSNTDLIAFLMGTLLSICLMVISNYPNWNSKYKQLLRILNLLIIEQNGIVTISDLALKAEISPVAASKFLKKFTQQLGIEPQVDDTGTLYYVFIKGKTISQQLQLKEKS